MLHPELSIVNHHAGLQRQRARIVVAGNVGRWRPVEIIPA
jgi:hypothetical protein